MVVGGVVGLHLIAFLLPSKDDVAGVPGVVDDSAEVARGAVVEVAMLMLVLFWYALSARGALGVSKLVPPFLDAVFILDLHGTHGVKCMYR
jgi:hypothetical protein